MRVAPSAVRRPGSVSGRFRHARRVLGWLDDRLAVLFLLPGLLCLATVLLYPVLYNLVVSFTDLSIMYPGFAFVGWENYAETFGDPALWKAAVRTLQWTFMSVLGQLLVGLVAALALEHVTRGRALLRLALVVPWAFPAIVMAFAWRFMLDGVYGVVNHLLMLAHIVDQPVAWLSTREWSMPLVVLMNIWFGFPFMMVCIVAGLASIPRELLEAAQVDGANYWQQLRYIILPALLPIIGMLVILRTIFVFNNFDFVFLTTGGGPVDATTTLPIHAFQVGWQRYDLGRMSAIAVAMLALLGLILAIYLRLLRSRERERV
jgi:multiple sugar transport system permease protein